MFIESVSCLPMQRPEVMPLAQQVPARLRTIGLAFDGLARLKESFMQELAFRTMLYRYFFFGWLFRDASQGNPIERSVAWRFNQAHAHWLLTYMRRWLWCGLFFYALGGVVELMLCAPGLSALFYVPCALSVPVNVVIGVLWVGLKALPGPL